MPKLRTASGKPSGDGSCLPGGAEAAPVGYRHPYARRHHRRQGTHQGHKRWPKEDLLPSTTELRIGPRGFVAKPQATIPAYFLEPCFSGQFPSDTPYTQDRPVLHPASYGHVKGRLPWAYARPRAAFSVRVRMESSGFLGMFRRSLFNLRARSKAPRLEISRNSGTSLPITPAT